MSLTITLLGEPVPFARMRLSARGAHFVPAPQRNAMAAIRLECQHTMLETGTPMFDEPIGVQVASYFPISLSWSRRRQAAALAGEILPAKRPDLDNIYKLAIDACNGIAFRDDAQIVALAAFKLYSLTPRLEITITAARDRLTLGVNQDQSRGRD